MSRYDLARLILRLDGVAFIVWAVIDLTYIGPIYNDFTLFRESEELKEATTRAFQLAVLRIGILLLVASILLAGTDRVISFLVQGKKSLGRKLSESDDDSNL